MRAPCVRCGQHLHTGEGRVLVAFTADELFEMIEQVGNDAVARRLTCALGLIDPDLERAINR